MQPLATAGRWAEDYVRIAAMWVATLASPSDPGWYATGDRRPVLLIPGVSENWQFLRPLAGRLHEAGHPVNVMPELGFNRGSVTGAAALVLERLRRDDLTGVAIVAHSKGGLVGKLAMARDTGRRIDRMVALATPFEGSPRAELLPLPHLTPLGPGDPLIASLAGITAPNALITSIYATWDEHVPGGSELAGATNVELPIAGHARITTHPAAIEAVLAALAN